MNGHTTLMKGSGEKYGRELDKVVSKKMVKIVCSSKDL